jgi:hypothetical protein
MGKSKWPLPLVIATLILILEYFLALIGARSNWSVSL